MTAFLRRVTSELMTWLGWDSATARGFGLGRPGTEWPTWSARTVLATARAERSPVARTLASAARVCR
jgi:hypothetical protein